MNRLLVLAHVFPRTVDDSMGAFLLHLADALAERGAQTDVVAPHAADLADDETIGAARVHRFHYAPARWEHLAYAGTMHEMVGRGIGGKILFAFFCLAFFFKTLSVARRNPHPWLWQTSPQSPPPSSTREGSLLAMTKTITLHAHWWLPGGFVGALVSMLTRAPLVITTHGTDVEMLRRARWAKPLARFTFARARTVTCGSTYLREQLLSLGVADAARVCVIPMPVNPQFAIPNSQFGQNNELRTPALAGGARVANCEILTVARLTAQKSIDTLLDAMAVLRERACDARLKIIGDGPERAALEQQTRALNLQDHVEFVGALPQKELPRHYAECAVFVLPSIREGMGLVFAEALLCGAPVIAANSGGVTDIVKDGDTGLLVPERDARALADAIEKMLNDRAFAARLASNGATWVRERYTRGRVAAQFAEVLK
jgi:glycosyltransferase involved in cell wall biosynthesis